MHSIKKKKKITQKKHMLIHATLNLNMSINVTDMLSAKEKPDLPVHGLPPTTYTHPSPFISGDHEHTSLQSTN